MKRLIQAALSAVFVLCLTGLSLAGDFDFLASMNVSAKANVGIFKVDLGARFGAPVPEVDAVFRVVVDPADAFMVFRIGEVAGIPPSRVLDAYKKNKGKGWGAIAQNLGIKPGSKEFQLLKKEESIGGKGKDKKKGKGK